MSTMTRADLWFFVILALATVVVLLWTAYQVGRAHQASVMAESVLRARRASREGRVDPADVSWRLERLRQRPHEEPTPDPHGRVLKQMQQRGRGYWS